MFGRFEELIVVLLIVLVLFGGKKVPQLARGIGQSIREVRSGFDGDAKSDAGPEHNKQA